jgi:hypothetical protein
MNRTRFLLALGEAKIDIVQITAAELKAEVADDGRLVSELLNSGESVPAQAPRGSVFFSPSGDFRRVWHPPSSD